MQDTHSNTCFKNTRICLLANRYARLPACAMFLKYVFSLLVDRGSCPEWRPSGQAIFRGFFVIFPKMSLFLNGSTEPSKRLSLRLSLLGKMPLFYRLLLPKNSDESKYKKCDCHTKKYRVSTLLIFGKPLF